MKIEIQIAKQEILGMGSNVLTKVTWGHLIWPRKVELSKCSKIWQISKVFEKF